MSIGFEASPAPVTSIINDVYLRSFLSPLAGLLARPEVTDLYVNQAGEVWVETLGGVTERHERPEMTDMAVMGLARQIAAATHQGISRAHPLLSAALPDGSRVQVVSPPATRGFPALAIRKHVSAALSLTDYVAAGAFAATDTATTNSSEFRSSPTDKSLKALLDLGDVPGLLSAAVRARRTILVSGGTSTGKTTFLNALLREIPPDERLILIEDTPELQMTHANSVGLLAARSALGEAMVTFDDLVAASLRLRPDRIILGELRGEEAYSFLRAVNTGHPGSMTTIHADSPSGAMEQIALLVLQRGTKLSREDILKYINSLIGVFVQLNRISGQRHVSKVLVNEPT